MGGDGEKKEKRAASILFSVLRAESWGKGAGRGGKGKLKGLSTTFSLLFSLIGKDHKRGREKAKGGKGKRREMSDPDYGAFLPSFRLSIWRMQGEKGEGKREAFGSLSPTREKRGPEEGEIKMIHHHNYIFRDTPVKDG